MSSWLVKNNKKLINEFNKVLNKQTQIWKANFILVLYNFYSTTLASLLY